MNRRYGNDDFGSTVFEMKGFLTSTLITSITIRSSTEPLPVPLIGRTAVFAGTFAMGLSAAIGAAVLLFYPKASVMNNVM